MWNRGIRYLQCSAAVFHTSLGWGYQNVLNMKQNVSERVHVEFLFSLLYVLKTKFKGSGCIQNVTLLG